MKIEVLYVSDCPNHAPVVTTITEILKECGLEEQIREIEVTDSERAIAMAFPGSPTVRINGTDIECDLPQVNSSGLTCRTYIVNGKRQSVPHRDWIRDAIMRAASVESGR